jgi:TrmH family RNA methyltransferase
LVFGSEKEGLTNEELSLCHLYVRIPSSESFPSLNLAQAVMVICYELFQSSMTISKQPTQLAEAEKLERMFEHMERTLVAIQFLDPYHPKRIMRCSGVSWEEAKWMSGRSESFKAYGAKWIGN